MGIQRRIFCFGFCLIWCRILMVIKMNIALISLGCSKNLVDSEMVLGLLKQRKYDITTNLDEANMIIINTCGFIESAKQEAITTILNAIDYRENGALIVVIGCLVQRYLEDLKKELPEVDLFIPISDYNHFGEKISSLLGERFDEALHHEARLITTKEHMAYVRIADGCDNKCHYCAIPLIRGPFVSRSEESIVSEVKKLVSNKAKEIVLISQDTTRYGIDLDKDTNIVSLLEKLIKIEGILFIRLLYLYPEEITYELIDFIKNHQDIVVPYFDVPIQHASNKILSSMNRRDTKENMLSLFSHIRKEIPKAILRTTVIVGYPGETKDDFEELLEFIKLVKFDRLGAFTYSKEEDTVAYSMPKQVASKTKEKRYEEIMMIQENIAADLSEAKIGEKQIAIVEDYDLDLKMYIARSYAFAPDDIDGYLFINTTEVLDCGDVVEVEIIGATPYDLTGKLVKKL